jgi:hypothetical protein
MVRNLTAALGLVLLGFGCETAAASCSPPIRFLHNQTVERTMTVRAGKKCSLSLARSSGPTYGVSIVERPRHGTVMVEAPHRVIYRASAGYVGQDSFSYARKGLDTRNNPVTSTIKVAVSILR